MGTEVKVSLTKDDILVLLFCIKHSLSRVRRNRLARKYLDTVMPKLDAAMKHFER